MWEMQNSFVSNIGCTHRMRTMIEILCWYPGNNLSTRRYFLEKEYTFSEGLHFCQDIVVSFFILYDSVGSLRKCPWDLYLSAYSKMFAFHIQATERREQKNCIDASNRTIATCDGDPSSHVSASRPFKFTQLGSFCDGKPPKRETGSKAVIEPQSKARYDHFFFGQGR